MKTKTLLIVATFFAAAITITSCKKEKVKGCLDSKSRTYNSEAEEDDGSCAYNGKATFWIDSNSVENFLIQGINKIQIYMNGSVAGTYDFATPIPVSSPSTCGESGYVSVNLDMGGDKITNGVVYTINNASNDTIITANSTSLEAGVCKSIHITH